MLHKSKNIIWVLSFITLPLSNVFAQLPIDGFFAKKNSFTLAPSFTYKTYNDFYVGDKLNGAVPANLEEINSTIISFYGQYAISDWLSGTVTLPYIQIESNNNTGAVDPVTGEDETDGIQDLGVYLKARIFENKFSDESAFTLAGAAGVSLPLGDYDERGIISLGNQATSYNAAAVAKYTTPLNIFAEVQFGYSLRENSDFDVPNALLYSAKLGYYNELFYLHAKLDIQNSTSGLDIGTPEFGAAGGPAILPETEVDYANLSFNFYVPIYKNSIGITAGYATIVDGRNFNKEEGYSFGLVYNSN